MHVEKLLDQMEKNWPDALTPMAACVVTIQRLGNLFRQNLQRSLVPFGLTAAEFDTLAALRASDPPHKLIPSDLYETMLISSGGLTKILKGLESKGLICRPLASGDGRRRPVALTEPGRALVEQAMSAVQQADAASLARAVASDVIYDDLFVMLAALARSIEAGDNASPVDLP